MKDRWVALQGITAHFARRLGRGWTYFYGVWDGDVYYGLLWFCGQLKTCCREHLIDSSIIDVELLFMAHDSWLQPRTPGSSFTLRPRHSTVDELEPVEVERGRLWEEIPEPRPSSKARPSWSWASACPANVSFCRPYHTMDGSNPRLEIHVLKVGHFALVEDKKPYLMLQGTLARLRRFGHIPTGCPMSIKYRLPSDGWREMIKVPCEGEVHSWLDNKDDDVGEACEALLVYQYGSPSPQMPTLLDKLLDTGPVLGKAYSRLLLLLIRQVTDAPWLDSVVTHKVYKRVGLCIFHNARQRLAAEVDPPAMGPSIIFLI